MKRTKKVTAVLVAEASQLGSVRRISRHEVTDVPETVWTRLQIKVPADLTLSSKVEDKVTLHTSKLVFRECGDTDGSFHIPAYKVVLADGTALLMGGKKRPYPIRTYEQDYSSNDSDSQSREVTITLTDVYEPPVIS